MSQDIEATGVVALNERAADLAHARYQEAERYVLGLISGPVTPPADTPRDEVRRRAGERLGRLRAFLEFLGNPQQQYNTIHIGGTSGKGSTTQFVASMLTAAGYRTGAHVSPYLQVATEKLQIDGKIASAERYAELVAKMRAKVEQWVALGHEQPKYGELWVAMTFVYFADEAVDYGVIEVGAGGRFDLTNVIQPEVAAITSVGLDHTVTLGATIPEIAWHKAGILKPGAAALTSVSDPAALEVIQDEARAIGVGLQSILPGKSYLDVRTGPHGTTFFDPTSGRTYSVPLPGTFQAANGALAVAIARALPGGAIADDIIQQGFDATRFPGRMEIVQERPLVLLDGAHNPQKIAGLAENLALLFPERRIVGVFGVLESKSYVEMLAELMPRLDALVATAPKVYAKPPVSAAQVAEQARRHVGAVEVRGEPLEAIQRALEIAGSDDVVLVTGSLYLIGNVRENWYPTGKILAQGTMWPK
jgi:dihydrofolate synthase/folylpolyglutamate synthase